MRLLIRYMQSRDSARHEFDGSVVTIGRGTDQTIQIADSALPLSHSTLSGSGVELTLTASSGQNFTVNGQIAKKQSLADGDVVEISGHKLTVLAGENGFDRTIEVVLNPDQISELKSRFTTGLKQINAPQRRFTWALFLILLAIGLVIPSIGFYVGMENLRDSPLPDDTMWLTGELHDSHAFMGDDCTFCHTKPFEQSRDEDCLYCHLSINHHFDTDKFGRDYKTGNSCGDCHKEHSSTESITRTDQDGCTICHADLKGSGFETDRLRSATDFLHDHPSFKLTMQRYDGDAKWHTERIDLWDEDLSEESNLIFPHDIHLAEEGIQSADGDVVMVCSDCHEADKGGYKMKIVTMEEHCSDCHALTFDPNTPDRVVPHGSPPDLMRTLREYYAYEFLNRGQAIKASTNKVSTATLELVETRTLRRPGKAKKRKSITDLIIEPSIDQSASLTEKAQSYIEAKVEDAASNLFEKQTCTICHEVTRVDDADVPWHVEPVLLSDDWMPLSIFKHESHKNMQCEGCHDAKFSTEASEVLMPDLVSCRNCHGGEEATGLLRSTCVTCHDFHMKGQGPMGELIEIVNPHIGTTKMETATLNLRNSDATHVPDNAEESEQEEQ